MVAAPEQSAAAGSVSRALQGNLTLFAQLMGLGLALWGPLIVIMIWLSGNLADIRQDIADLDRRLTAQINELDARLTAQINELDARLTARINELDARLTAQIQAMDAKLNAIGDMTVVAFTDGEISSDELVVIWERANWIAEPAE